MQEQEQEQPLQETIGVTASGMHACAEVCWGNMLLMLSRSSVPVFISLKVLPWVLP